MSQKLLLPFASCKVVAGYKLIPYRNYWGYDHYGIDYKAIGSLNVLASGEGTVVTVGFDYAVGSTVCIVYKDAYNHKTGKSSDLVARYMHLASIAVIAGQTVKAGDLLGVEGKTGSGNWSEHLHVEFDTDTKWPNYSPQVKGSNLIKKTPAGYPDTTVNPSDLFHRGESQTIINGGNAGWTTSADWTLPEVITADAVDDTAELRKRIVQLEHDLAVSREAADIWERTATEAQDKYDRLRDNIYNLVK